MKIIQLMSIVIKMLKLLKEREIEILYNTEKLYNRYTPVARQ